MCLHPRDFDHAGNLLQSLVLSHGILKSYEKEKGNSCVRASPPTPPLHPPDLCNPQVQSPAVTVPPLCSSILLGAVLGLGGRWEYPSHPATKDCGVF